VRPSGSAMVFFIGLSINFLIVFYFRSLLKNSHKVTNYL